MLPIIKPREAEIIVASISKLIINNPRFWEFWRELHESEPEPEHDENKDATSNTTSINELETRMHHFDPLTPGRTQFDP